MRKKLNVIAMGILTSVMMVPAAHALEIINSELERNVADDSLNLILDFDEPMPSSRLLIFEQIRESTQGTLGFRSAFTDSCSQDVEKPTRINCLSMLDGMPADALWPYKPTATDKARGYVILSANGRLRLDNPSSGPVLNFRTEDYEWDIPIEPEPQMLMQMAQYVDLKEGQTVDQQLRWHPTFPVPSDAELSFEIAPADVKHPTGLGHRAALPAGLSMTATGRLTGTLTQVADSEDWWVFFVSKAAKYPDRLYVVPVNFKIASATQTPDPVDPTGPSAGGNSDNPKFVFRMTTYQNANIQ